MKIDLKLTDAPFHMTATNPNGNEVHIDASPEIGGQDKGVRPTELLLMGVAGCSGIDILSILSKQRQTVTHFHVSVEGDKEKVDTYSLFRQIRIHYTIDGDIEPAKAKQAIELSLGKYCSVSKTMEHTAQIHFTLTVNGTTVN